MSTLLLSFFIIELLLYNFNIKIKEGKYFSPRVVVKMMIGWEIDCYVLTAPYALSYGQDACCRTTTTRFFWCSFTTTATKTNDPFQKEELCILLAKDATQLHNEL